MAYVGDIILGMVPLALADRYVPLAEGSRLVVDNSDPIQEGYPLTVGAEPGDAGDGSDMRFPLRRWLPEDSGFSFRAFVRYRDTMDGSVMEQEYLMEGSTLAAMTE